MTGQPVLDAIAAGTITTTGLWLTLEIAVGWFRSALAATLDHGGAGDE